MFASLVLPAILSVKTKISIDENSRSLLGVVLSLTSLGLWRCFLNQFASIVISIAVEADAGMWRG